MSARACPFKTDLDFSQRPLLAIWETTRSCALACRHCRAEAELARRPGELDTREGRDLLDQIAGMGTPIAILSGGDPLNRDDLEGLVAHGKSRGLRMGTIPAATPQLTHQRLRALQEAGLDQIAFSLDAPTADLHDGFRGVPGSFERTMTAARWARELGLPLQVNTCFASWNIEFLGAMIDLVRSLGISFWEVFFLVPMGRGAKMHGLAPEGFEAAFARLADLADERQFVVKLTEAQHFRRFLAQRGSSRNDGSAPRTTAAISGGTRATAQAVNAGKGFLFVDYHGDVCPSGFLPIPAGNVRERGLAEIYRDAPLFRELRDAALLKGKCGRCEFAQICSGSRARAFAMTGDHLASDPACVYRPRQSYDRSVCEAGPTTSSFGRSSA